MLAYNTELLDHTEILLHAKKWHKNKSLSDLSYDAIKNKYTNHLYTPNFFIRIGLFIFTVISASAANSLIMLFTGFFDSEKTGIGIRFIVHGIITLAILELLIKKKNIYKSGIDDALLYMGLSALIGGICVLAENYPGSDKGLLFAFLALPFLIAAAIRYSDMLITTCVFVCLFFIIFILVSKAGEIAKYGMPFFITFLSALCYLQIVKYRGKEKLRFWDSSMMITEILSLILFYMAGNYFIVRTLSEELFSLQLQNGEDIPLSFIFYAYTAIIPVAYIFLGLKKKNKLLLQTGLILVVLSVITFKYYFSLGHPEITMTIGGIIMIIVAWLSINYFKIPKFGITYIEDKDEKVLENFDAEALIIAQTFSGPQHQNNNNPELGGGKFGGGGADSSF
jgi:hypothetical protein